MVMLCFPLVGVRMGMWILSKLCLQPSYLSQCGFLFISFVVYNLLVFSSFSERVVYM